MYFSERNMVQRGLDAHGNPQYWAEYTLWRTNGTPETTVSLKHFPRSINLARNFRVGNQLLFTAETFVRSSDQAIWRTDGTVAGTFIVGPDSTTENGFIWYNAQEIRGTTGGLFVRYLVEEWDGDDNHESTSHWEEWFTDGTPENTQKLKTENEQGDIAIPQATIQSGSTMFCISGNALWTCDGTPQGMHKIRTFEGSIGGLRATPDGVTFLQTNAGQTVFWKSNGTEAGTVRLYDDLAFVNRGEEFPADDRLFFWATVVGGSNQLWTWNTRAAQRPAALT